MIRIQREIFLNNNFSLKFLKFINNISHAEIENKI